MALHLCLTAGAHGVSRGSSPFGVHAQLCKDDGLWYSCGHDKCTGLRACASNKGLLHCACHDTRPTSYALVIHAAGSSEQQPRLTNGEGQFEQQRLLEGSTLGRIGQCGATALLIEPRKQPMAMLAMATVAQNMPNVTCFLVYHGPGNLAWLRNQPIVSHLLALGRLNLRPLPEYAAPLRSESDHESRPLEPGLRREWDSVLPQTLFMRYDFWAGLPTETVLNFQSDSVLCRPLDLSRWASFAQVGAPWRALKCNQTRVLWHRMSGGRAPATAAS